MTLCDEHGYMGVNQCPKCVAEAEVIRRESGAVPLSNFRPGSCPFCGSAMRELVTCKDGTRAVRCQRCGTEGPRAHDDAGAQRAWDRAVPRQDSVQDEAEEKLPTRDEHSRFIRRIWVGCIVAAVAIFVILGGVVLSLFLKGYDSKKIVEVSTAVFQVLVLSYGMGFFVPAFITSLLTMALGVAMNRRGLAIGQKTAKILDRVDAEIEARLNRVDNLITLVEDAFSAKGKHPIHEKLNEFLTELRYIRVEVSKGASKKEELDQAAAEGERIAALIRGEAVPCPTCGHELRLTQDLLSHSNGGFQAVCDGCRLRAEPAEEKPAGPEPT